MNIEKLKELREKTNVSMNACRKALEESSGDMDKAIKILKTKSLMVAGDVSEKSTSEGKICSYIHPGNKLAVLLEVQCETDFAARSEDFNQFCESVYLQIAGMSPIYLSRDQVDDDKYKDQREIFTAQVKDKPEKIQEKIIEGKFNKWFGDVCLLEQKLVQDNDKTVKQLRDELIGKLRENVVIKRFVRWEI